MLHRWFMVSWAAVAVMTIVARSEAGTHVQFQAVTVVPHAVVVAPAAVNTCVATSSVVSLVVPTVVQQRVVKQQVVRPSLFSSRSVRRTVVRSRF